MKTVGELLPHPALHSLEALAQARMRRVRGGALGAAIARVCESNYVGANQLLRGLQDKIVMIVFEAGSDKPVMFHMAFKAGFSHAIVLHLGLVMVTPEHQACAPKPCRAGLGPRVRRMQHAARCFLSIPATDQISPAGEALAASVYGEHDSVLPHLLHPVLRRYGVHLPLCTPQLSYKLMPASLQDIADSPSNTKQVGDSMLECYPNYRHNNSVTDGARPKQWQVDVARFMMAYHRADFGTSAEAVFDVRFSLFPAAR